MLLLHYYYYITIINITVTIGLRAGRREPLDHVGDHGEQRLQRRAELLRHARAGRPERKWQVLLGIRLPGAAFRCGFVKPSRCHCTDGHLTSRVIPRGSTKLAECRPHLGSTSPLSPTTRARRCVGRPRPRAAPWRGATGRRPARRAARAFVLQRALTVVSTTYTSEFHLNCKRPDYMCR